MRAFIGILVSTWITLSATQSLAHDSDNRFEEAGLKCFVTTMGPIGDPPPFGYKEFHRILVACNAEVNGQLENICLFDWPTTNASVQLHSKSRDVVLGFELNENLLALAQQQDLKKLKKQFLRFVTPLIGPYCK